MEGFVSFVQGLNTNVLAKPEYILGLFALAGCLIMKRKWYEALSAFTKTMVGYFLLTVGSSGLTSTFRPILFALNQKFNISAAVIDPYFMSGITNDPETGIPSIPNMVTYILIALITIYIWNFVLVFFSKFTKLRTLYVRSLYASISGEVFIIMLLLPNWRDAFHAVLIGLVIATRLTFLANLTVEPTRKLTNNAGFAIGHQQMLAIWWTTKLAPKIGNPEDSVENTKMPGWMSIFNDSTVSTALLMTLFMGAIMLICGKETMMGFDSGLKASDWYLTYIISKCFYFAVYINVLISGVRMFSGELLKAFNGISEKYLPGSTIAVDIAVTFGFTNPAVIMIGFICGFLGQLTIILSLIVFKSPILMLTGFVPVFFDNAGLAIYANKLGGRKAAMVIPFINGCIQVIGSLLILLWFRKVGFVWNAWTGQHDNATIVPLMYLVIYYLKEIGAVAFILSLLGLSQVYYSRHKQNYFGEEDKKSVKAA